MRKVRNLIGQRFGRLEVISKVIQKDCYDRDIICWLCQCDCGNVKIIRGSHLTSGSTKSCGCYRSEWARAKILDGVPESINSKKAVEKRNMSRILGSKLQKDNKSGKKGVYWNEKDKRWRAVISYKGKLYYLGEYSNIDDAIRIRKFAEKQISNFNLWYNTYFKLEDIV